MEMKLMSPGGRADRISDLPDGVIGEIISRLPTKDGARTQLLASRWSHLWRSAPLNLALPNVADHRRGAELAAVISRILSTHPGPARRFCVPVYYCSDRLATVDAWLASPALDSLQELDLFYGVHSTPLPPLPASFFRFLPTLRIATIGHCHLTDGAVQGLHFPHLKQLGLEVVHISEYSLHSMIAACSALECLLLKCNFGFQCVRINSHTLRSIGVRVDPPRDTSELQLRELIIENAPCLEMLLSLDRPDVLHITVMSAPKLETLGCLIGGNRHHTSDFRFVFGSIVIQVQSGDYKFIAEQHRKLQLTKRASRGARFHFTTHSCLRAVSQLKHVRDLDLTDPFISRC